MGELDQNSHVNKNVHRLYIFIKGMLSFQF